MTRPMPSWWLKKRSEARQKKDVRSRKEALSLPEPSTPTWTYVRQPEPKEPPRRSMPSANPRSLYQFCVERQWAYADRGEPVAGLVYWVLRTLDDEDPEFDPCTDEGFKDLCDYFAYKMDWYESRPYAPR